MPWIRGQVMGGVEYKHPSTTAMQSLQLHAPQRREVRVGSYVRFQRTVITGKVTSDLVMSLVFPFQLSRLDPH